MKAYIYRAALYCQQCGEKLKANLDGALADSGATPGTQDGDSERYPQGPYDNGGGEADCPQHCDACGVFLENPLTSDGDKYVREAAGEYDAPDSSWDEIATRAEQDGKPVLADWIRYYFAPGQ